MTLNVSLLLGTLDYIETHPDEHDQDYFRHTTDCGTVMCFAGWAATLTGGEWANTNELFAEPDDRSNARISTILPGRRVVDPDDRARRVLGLTYGQADRLFYDCDTLDDVRHEVKRIIEDHELERERVGS